MKHLDQCAKYHNKNNKIKVRAQLVLNSVIGV